MTEGSSQSAYVLGTGTFVEPSAVMTLYSRSTACADGSRLPGGLRLTTYRFPVREVMRNVGLD
jgi:hypothetical protein